MFYTEARTFALSARDHRSKPVASRDHPQNARNTRVEILDDHTVGIRLHDTHVVKLFEDGSFELNTGGWYTVTTKSRINEFAPAGIKVGGRRVGKAPSRWWVHLGWEPIAPFFDGIRIDHYGEILNPQPGAVVEQAQLIDTATDKAITKYLDTYMKAAEAQIYVDALYQEPEGAQTCWDCGMVAAGKPELEGRTTTDGNRTDHLERHVGNQEIVPELAWVALKAKGYREPAIFLGSTDHHIVEINRGFGARSVRDSLRSYLRSRLLSSTTGARPTPFVRGAA